MEIKPRTVEPGYLQRWFKQSIAMMLYSPLNWIIALGCLYMLDGTQIHTALKVLIGMMFIIMGFEFSHYAYERQNSIDIFAKSVFTSIKSYMVQIRLRMLVIVIILVGVSLLIYAQQEAISKMTPEELAKIKTSAPRFMGDAVWFIIFGITFLNMGGMLRIFSHMLYRYFGMEEKSIIDSQCHNAALQNKGVSVANEMVLFLFIFGLGVFVPALVFLAYPIYCGMVYLAFREIFVGDSGVKAHEEAKEESFIAKPAMVENQ